jgi:hypothetical protein
MKFFIPHLRDDPGAAEREWQRYLQLSPAPADSRRVYSVTYEHDGSKYVVTVGEARQEYRRKTGPRGGYIKNAGYLGYSTPTGTEVSGIIATRTILYVWSYGPPFGGWANPSLVGISEVGQIE